MNGCDWPDRIQEDPWKSVKMGGGPDVFVKAKGKKSLKMCLVPKVTLFTSCNSTLHLSLISKYVEFFQVDLQQPLLLHQSHYTCCQWVQYQTYLNG